MLLAVALLSGACGESGRTPPVPAEGPPAAVPGPAAPQETPAAPAPAPVADDVSEHPRLGAYVRFPGSGVRMRAPEGYEQPAAFHGFARPSATCSVVATKIPAPFAELTRGFTEEQFASRGWALESKEETAVAGRPGILVRFRQPTPGTMFRRAAHWLVIQAADAYMILRLEDRNVQRVLEAVEMRTGVRIDRPAPQ